MNKYIKITDNLLLQSTLFYCDSFDKLYNSIIDLINIFKDSFTEKNELYSNLLFFIFRQEYKNIYIEEIRLKVLETFFDNKLLLKNSKIFLVETMKNFKPELFNDKTYKDSVSSFMNIEHKKFDKIRNIINICNKKNSPEFNEILLYFFEGLCQSYFFSILKNIVYDSNNLHCIR